MGKQTFESWWIKAKACLCEGAEDFILVKGSGSISIIIEESVLCVDDEMVQLLEILCNDRMEFV